MQSRSGAMSPTHYNRWRCPFCGFVATQPTQGTPRSLICESRTCSCNAVALAAPSVDLDEIIDDAVGIFGIAIRDESRGVDALMLGDIRRAGVEVRRGESVPARQGLPLEYVSVWFRGPRRETPERADARDASGSVPRFCHRCGKPVGAAAGLACGACGASRPERSPDITYMICSSCGQGTPGGSSYCEWCGVRFG